MEVCSAWGGLLKREAEAHGADRINRAVSFYRSGHAATLVIEPSNRQLTVGHSFETAIACASFARTLLCPGTQAIWNSLVTNPPIEHNLFYPMPNSRPALGKFVACALFVLNARINDARNFGAGQFIGRPLNLLTLFLNIKLGETTIPR